MSVFNSYTMYLKNVVILQSNSLLETMFCGLLQDKIFRPSYQTIISFLVVIETNIHSLIYPYRKIVYTLIHL